MRFVVYIICCKSVFVVGQNVSARAMPIGVKFCNMVELCTPGHYFSCFGGDIFRSSNAGSKGASADRF